MGVKIETFHFLSVAPCMHEDDETETEVESPQPVKIKRLKNEEPISLGNLSFFRNN